MNARTGAPAGAPARGPGPVSQATTLRYMGRFQCIGGACEDNCCSHSWNIVIDQPDFVRLERALSGSPQERARFERGCVHTTNRGPTGTGFAQLVATPGGYCTFLAPDGLCSVHSAHGATALPKVCATYPRILSEVEGRMELASTLSCPEAARLCLLADDAVRIDSLNPSALEGLAVRHRFPAAADSERERFVADRSAFVHLLSQDEFSLATRLAASVRLAARLDRTHGIEERQAAIDQGTSAEALRAIDHDSNATGHRPALPLVLVQEILITMQRLDGPARLVALADAVFAPFLEREASATEPDSEPEYALNGDAMWETYSAQRKRWESGFSKRISQYFTNYAVNYWMATPVASAAPLLPHVLHLLTRVAVLRFLLFLHPALRETGDQGALDRAMVEACYIFSRAVEHSSGAREVVDKLLEHYEIRGVAHGMELAAF